MKDRNIKVFYTPKQVCIESIQSKSYSKSPLKPMLYMEYLFNNGFGDNLDVNSTFSPLHKRHFRLAHTRRYVNHFFNGTGNCKSNGLPWSVELTESVRYTNASLYAAIRHSIENPTQISLSPTSGFHHARPDEGSGFCTFSGQVIAAMRIYRKYGKRAAFLDLDGHFGNSIEDSKVHVKDLNKIIPFNINPRGSHKEYVVDLRNQLNRLTQAFLNKKVDYVVWCHGADSHEWDQLGYQCTTEEWLECSYMFYEWVKMMQVRHQITIPVALSLFGGYRDDDYNSVLSLHASDLQVCLETLCGVKINHHVQVKQPGKKRSRSFVH